MNKVLSDERLGAKLRVAENQCVVLFFNLCILSSSTTALSTLCHFMSTLFFDLCMYVSMYVCVYIYIYIYIKSYFDLRKTVLNT